MLRTKRFFHGQVVVGSILIAATAAFSPHEFAIAVTKNLASVRLKQHSTKSDHRSTAAAHRVMPQRTYELLIKGQSVSWNSNSGPCFAITLRNNTNETVYVGETGRIRDFVVEVRDSSSKTIPPNQPGQEPLIVEEGKQSVVALNAGQEFTFHIDLAEAYSLPPEPYELSAKKTVIMSDMRTTVEVRSDNLRFMYESSR